MQTSIVGQAFIQSFEGFRAFPYTDQGGKPTIGFGHLITRDDPDFSMGVTPDAAAALFCKDLYAKAERFVNEHVMMDLEQHEYDALVSICFNIGGGNFITSTLLKIINIGATPELTANQFLKWDHVNGFVSHGLLLRRQAEARMYTKGIYQNHA